ncbi:MAG: efflux RND transporter periplasmic adaptor subunit [Planctomycetota bacterium]|jgi:RND family efflux transporter MFP subunit|nr:efflux RND transporter periplasmic adaptor subunit [Planctomycetota bacterium]
MLRSRAKRFISWFFLVGIAMAVCLAAFAKIREGRKVVRMERAQQDLEVDLRSPRLVAQPPRWHGWVRPSRRTIVPSQVSGVVREHHLRVGASVGTEAVLVQFTDHHQRYERAIRAQLKKQQELRVTDAQADYEEIMQMDREGSDLLVTPVRKRKAKIAWDQARHELSSLEAQLEQMDRKIEEHAVQAPYAGLVQKVFIEVGQWVNAGQPLFELIEIEPLRIEFHVSSRWLNVLEEGVWVQVWPRSHPGERVDSESGYRARVTEIAPEAESTTHQVRVVARLNPGLRLLRPGTIVEIEPLADSGKE